MADKGKRGGLDPPFLADIICEQPLMGIVSPLEVPSPKTLGGPSVFPHNVPVTDEGLRRVAGEQRRQYSARLRLVSLAL